MSTFNNYINMSTFNSYINMSTFNSYINMSTFNSYINTQVQLLNLFFVFYFKFCNYYKYIKPYSYKIIKFLYFNTTACVYMR